MISYFENRRNVLKQGLREGSTNIYCLFSNSEIKLWETIKKTETVEVQNLFFTEAMYTRSHQAHNSQCNRRGYKFTPTPLTNNLLTNESFVLFGLSQFLARGKNVFIDQNQIFDTVLLSLSKQINLDVSAIQNLSVKETISAILTLRQKDPSEQIQMYMSCKEEFNHSFKKIVNNMHALFVHAIIKINDLCPHAHSLGDNSETFKKIVQSVLGAIEALSQYLSLDCTGTLARYLIVHFHHCARMSDFDILKSSIYDFVQFLKNNSESILPGCDDMEGTVWKDDIGRLMCAVEHVSTHVSSNVVALYRMSPSQMMRELQTQLLWPKYMIEFILPAVINEASMPEQFFMASLLNDICCTYPQCRIAIYLIFLLCYTKSNNNMPILSTAFHDLQQDVTPERIKYVISELEELALLSVVMFKDTNNFNDEMVRFQRFCHGLAPDVAAQVTFDDFVHTVHSYCVSLSFHMNMDQKMIDHANNHDGDDFDELSDSEPCQTCDGSAEVKNDEEFGIGMYSDPDLSDIDSEGDQDLPGTINVDLMTNVHSKPKQTFFYDLAKKNNIISTQNKLKNGASV